MYCDHQYGKCQQHPETKMVSNKTKLIYNVTETSPGVIIVYKVVAMKARYDKVAVPVTVVDNIL